MNWAEDLSGLPRLKEWAGIVLLVCPTDGDQPEATVSLPAGATVRNVERALRDLGWSKAAATRDASLIRCHTPWLS
ncbi:MAG: hypothetical protein ABIR54_07110 [Burkholderiaceae bacterium]